ncbi:MAG TPA: response regulator transcription factor [Terriglobia bacterium]|nr:response regulator transcription factor [Terriglobia bacterium]
MKVLVVDDSLIVVERLIDILEQVRGLEVIGRASDIPEAEQLIERLNPDVVILDLQMPKGRGIDVLGAVKLARPNTIVIVLSNFTYPQYRKRCQDAGADFFLDKSTDFQKIPEIFEGLLESSLVTSPPHI